MSVLSSMGGRVIFVLWCVCFLQTVESSRLICPRDFDCSFVNPITSAMINGTVFPNRPCIDGVKCTHADCCEMTKEPKCAIADADLAQTYAAREIKCNKLSPDDCIAANTCTLCVKYSRDSTGYLNVNLTTPDVPLYCTSTLSSALLATRTCGKDVLLGEETESTHLSFEAGNSCPSEWLPGTISSCPTFAANHGVCDSSSHSLWILGDTTTTCLAWNPADKQLKAQSCYSTRLCCVEVPTVVQCKAATPNTLFGGVCTGGDIALPNQAEAKCYSSGMLSGVEWAQKSAPADAPCKSLFFCCFFLSYVLPSFCSFWFLGSSFVRVHFFSVSC